MNRLSFYIIALLFLSACGSQEKKEDNNKKSFTKIDKINKTHNTLALNALGKELVWQKEVKKFDYKSAVEYCKNLTLDGKSDWRLPSSKEFFALLDNNSSIDEQFEKSSDIKSLWTRDEFALDKKMAWKLNSWSNSISYSDKNSSFGVRCVRGDMLSNDPLKNRENREIIWRDEKNSKDALFTYDEAKEYCKNKKLRLPTIHELQNSIDLSSLKSSLRNIDKNEFISYFSSTTLPTNSDEVMTLNFKTGMISFNKKDELNHLICVGEKNHPPTVTQNQSVELQEDSQKNITLGGMDKDGDELKIIIKKMPDHGTYKDGIYTPDANFNGKDSIKYKLFDSKEYSKEAEVVINVLPINDPPKAKSFDISLDEDSNITFKLEASDVDEDNLSYQIIQDALHGELIKNNNVITYIPNRDYDKNDTFRYIAKDGNDGYSNIATVHINIRPINDKPKASPQIVDDDNNTTLIIGSNNKVPKAKDINITLDLNIQNSTKITLKGSDPKNSPLTYQIDTNNTKGKISGNAPNLIYTPKSGFIEVDSFRYRVSDGYLYSNWKSVNIFIKAKKPKLKTQNIRISEDDKTLYSKVALDQGKALSFSTTNPPIGFKLDINGSFSFDPSNEIYQRLKEQEKRELQIPITVVDKFNQKDTKELNITIIGRNDAPAFKNSLELNISEDENKSINLFGYIKDIDSDTFHIIDLNSSKINISYNDLGYATFNPKGDYNYLAENKIYTIKVPFIFADEQSDEITTDLKINIIGKNDAPKAVINLTPNTIYINDTVSFDASNSSDIDGNITRYQWSDESGQILSKTKSFTTSFTTSGEHNITLQVWDDKNEVAVAKQKITISKKSSSFFQQITLDNSIKNHIITWIEPAKIDSDELVDLVVTYRDYNNKSILMFYKNLGDGSFEKHQIFSNFDIQLARVDDMNGDGKNDIILSGASTKICFNYINQSSDLNNSFECFEPLTSKQLSGLFTGSDLYSVDDDITFLTTNDFDKNGKKDIVVTSWTDNKLQLYNQNSNNLFPSEPKTVETLTSPTGVESGDIDNDGFIDLIISDANGVQYLQNQNGSDFNTSGKSISLKPTNSVAIANINGVGNLDIIMTHTNSIDWSSTSFTTMNSGDIDTNIANPPYAFGIDMNGDGNIDIVSNSNETQGEIVWYETNIDKYKKVKFTKHIIADNMDNISITRAADLDNDGDIDIISGDESGNLYLFKQN